MKKILALLFMLFAATNAYAIPPMPSSTPPVGTITGLFTGEGDYLKSDGTKGTPSGSGDIVQSGSPANHYWAYFTADKTVTGVAITASKPVCSDANGDPAVCAGTEGVWQPVNASLTALSGLSSPITIDDNNIKVPGALITTAANGDRRMETLDNTTTLTFLKAGTYGWYFSNGLPYFNVNGTGYKSMYEGGSFGGLIFGDASPDAAGEIGYDGELKYYDAVGLKTIQTVKTEKLAVFNIPGDSADNTVVDAYVPVASTITGVLITTTGAACSAVVDIWSDTYANFPATVADTITASAKPTLSTAQKNKDITLTGWTTAIAADSVLRANLDSSDCTGLIQVTIFGTK